jgi:hypothetical protein
MKISIKMMIVFALSFVVLLNSTKASIILSDLPDATWTLSPSSGSSPLCHDTDASTNWYESYNSHESGNIDITATLTFAQPVTVDSISTNWLLLTSCRSFQEGGSDQGRWAVAEVLYKVKDNDTFICASNSNAYERVDEHQNDGESRISWNRTINVNLQNVVALKWLASVASYTNEANAADGSIRFYEASATGTVPEPSTAILLTIGVIGMLVIYLRREWH